LDPDHAVENDSFIYRAKLIDYTGNMALSKLVYLLDLNKKESYLGKTITEASVSFPSPYAMYLPSLLELYGNYKIVEALTRNQNEFSGLILEHESHVVICYAGTKSLPDWGGNLNVLQDEYSQNFDEKTIEDDYVLINSNSGEKFHGHAGFLNNYRASKEELERVFSRHKNDSKLVITSTGHSLGGALALNALLDAIKFFFPAENSQMQVTLEHMSFCAPPALSQEARDHLY
jgi:hypothetical protein